MIEGLKIVAAEVLSYRVMDGMLYAILDKPAKRGEMLIVARDCWQILSYTRVPAEDEHNIIARRVSNSFTATLYARLLEARI